MTAHQDTIEQPAPTDPMGLPPFVPSTVESIDSQTAELFPQTADLLRRIEQESSEADNGWRLVGEMTELAQSTAAQLAGAQVHIVKLSHQLELARESASEWQTTARGAERISEERRIRLDRMGAAVEDLTSSLAAQSEVTTSELNEIQARWQKTEDQRFAAVEQCMALEQRCSWLNRANDELVSEQARLCTSVEQLEAELAKLETTYTELENQHWKASCAGRDAIEALAIENFDEPTLSLQLKTVEEHLLGGFGDDLRARFGEIPASHWLSSRAADLEEELSQYQQAEHEALCESRPLSEDLAERLSMHPHGDSGQADCAVCRAFASRPEPSPEAVVTCGTCAQAFTSAEVEPCASCCDPKNQRPGNGYPNWKPEESSEAAEAIDLLNTNRTSSQLVDAVHDQKTEGTKSLRELGWDVQMTPEGPVARTDDLDDAEEEESAEPPAKRSEDGPVHCIDQECVKGHLHGGPHSDGVRLWLRQHEENDRPQIGTNSVRETFRIAEELGLLDRRPNTCSSEHPRALDKLGRVLSRRSRGKSLKSSSRMHSESGGTEGRTCDGKSEIGLSKPVTRDALETSCQNMANRLESGAPGRAFSPWLDKVLDKVSSVVGLDRTQDLALRMLVKRPSGRGRS
jgi:hypothetical protein